jgi:regulator of sirC expression with transglutaminase-like and TPR domain
MLTLTDHESNQPDRPTLAQALAHGTVDDDPALLSLLMAAEFYPTLDVRQYLQRIDSLAARVQELLGRARTPARVVSAINTVLFDEDGFAGNVDDYYDPRNSFLNEVLDRRTGIPISLSALYLAVARRIRQPFAGVGLPLHFVVRFTGPRAEIYVDAFQHGEVLSREDCLNRVESTIGPTTAAEQESFLSTVTSRAMLFRMLANLKLVYVKRHEFALAAKTVNLMLQVRPNDADEVRDLGLLHYQMEEWGRAAQLLQRYMEKNPDASDADSVRERLRQASDRRARLN